MIEVNFRRMGYRYAVRFGYNAALVEHIKDSIPAFARDWQPTTKTWVIDAYYARTLAADLATIGCQVTGLDPEPDRRKSARNGTNAEWARNLFRAVGPERSDAVFRSLTRILHPDNPATGDPRLQRELNDARSEIEN